MIFKNDIAKHNVIVLALAQAFLGSQMPMLFILGGLAGQYLIPNPCFATLPVSLIIIGSTVSAPILANFMQKYGRKEGFMLGALCGAVGALLSSYGLLNNSYLFFLLGSLVNGVYMASYGFYRFAATDCASKEFRPKAISYVMSASLISAIIGPQLVKISAEMFPVPFLGPYITIILLNVSGIGIFSLLNIPLVDKRIDIEVGRSRIELLRSNNIRLAIMCGIITYALMNLMMTSAPIAIVGCGYGQNNAADAVMTHVLAMALPSFFTGHLIVKLGVKKVLSTGIFFLFCASIIGYLGTGLINFYLALIFLGIGWNFGFISATTILTSNHKVNERGTAQGMNDMIVFGFVALASLTSGSLMNCSGSSQEIGWSLVSISMIPLLITAMIAVTKLSENK